MADHPEIHRRAALRHEQAAANHDRAATYWDQVGRRKQAGLQRRLADYERHGAELERQWAGAAIELVTDRAESTRSLTRKQAEHLSAELDRAAEALEKTASLADQHARRRREAGKSEGEQEERRVADRARKYALRARAQAQEWRNLATRAGPQSADRAER